MNLIAVFVILFMNMIDIKESKNVFLGKLGNIAEFSDCILTIHVTFPITYIVHVLGKIQEAPKLHKITQKFKKNLEMGNEGARLI